jgi:Domain of Unknown Function (DUF928)
MCRKHSPQIEIKVACLISLLLIAISSYPQKAQSHLAQSIPIKKENGDLKFPDNGEPKGRRRGGTSRQDVCPQLNTQITALVPGREKNNESLSFLTPIVAEYPTFWVYLPELPPNLRAGEFVLQDSLGNDILRKPLALSGKPGVIAISLPPNPQYALKQNKSYHWYFKVFCNRQKDHPEYFYVDAWVKKIALTPLLKQELGRAKSGEYKTYQRNQLWYDALTNLVELRRQNPQDKRLIADWRKLLTLLGLEELGNTQIVDN